MVDVGASRICIGISVVFVFWWAFFTESLSDTGSVVSMPSWLAT